MLDKYRWEIRLIVRDGMVSFDGVRYGVPWQYSGKEARIRLCAGYLEIYYGEVLLTKHKAQYHSGNVVFLRGQYNTADLRREAASPYPSHVPDSRTAPLRYAS